MATNASLGTATLVTQLDTSGFKVGLDKIQKDTERTFGQIAREITDATHITKIEIPVTAPGMDTVMKELNEMQGTLKVVNDEVSAGLKPMAEYRKELVEQEKELLKVVSAQERGSDAYKESVSQLALVREELKRTTPEIVKQSDAWDKLAAKGKGIRNFGIALTVGVTTPLTVLGAVGIKSAMQLETFAASLNVLIGDAERANRVFDELYEFSANVPFDWRTLSDATRTLAGFGVEAEDIVGTLSKLGDIAAGTQSDLVGLTEIYGRVLVTGRLSMQEVNSLAQRGVPIFQELANVLGVSTDQVRELISSGTIGFPQLQRVIENLTGEGGKFFGMMDAQAETVEGRLNRLKDSFEQVTDAIGERLLPAFDWLIGKGQEAADWFNKLDESTKGLFVGLGVTVAAGGPLLVGLGTLLTMLPKIRTQLTLLRVALSGPVGIMATLVTSIAGLAIAFSGKGDSLDKSIEKANDALAGEDSDSLTSALGDVAKSLDSESPLRARLLELQEELKNTGEVGEEMARKIKEALLEATVAPLRAELNALNQSLSQREALLAAHTSDDAAARQARINELEAIGNALFDQGAATIPTEITDELMALRMASEGMGMSAEEIARSVGIMTADRERAAELEKRIAELLAPAPASTGGGGGGSPPPPGVGGAVKRTIDDIIKELNEAGTHAMRVAAFEGTKEAAIAAVQTRMQLTNKAISELLSDPFYGMLPDGLLDEMKERLVRQNEELISLTRGLPGVRPLGTAAQAMMIRAEVEGPGAGMATGMTRAQIQAALKEAIERRLLSTKWADYLADEVGREYDRFISLLPSNVARGQEQMYLASLADTDSEMERFTSTAYRLAEAIKEANKEAARMAMFEAALERYGDGRTGLAGTSAADRTGGTAVANNEAMMQILRESVVQTTAAYQRGEATLDDVQKAVDALTSVMSMSVLEINELTEGVLQLGRAAQNAKRDADALSAIEDSPGTRLPATFAATQTGILTPDQRAFNQWYSGIAHRRDGGREGDGRLKEAQRIIEEQKKAANDFALTVVNAGVQFGDAAIKAFKDGDIVGLIRAGISGAQSVVGAMDMGKTNLLGGMIGTNVLVGLGLGLLGSLFGAIAGGGNRRQEEERRRQEAMRRSVPAVNINFNVQQTNNYHGGPRDPANELAFSRNADTMFESFYTRVLSPRLDRIERAVGLSTGA